MQTLCKHFTYIYKTSMKLTLLLVLEHKVNSTQLNFLISSTFGVSNFKVLFILILHFFLSLLAYGINFNYKWSF